MESFKRKVPKTQAEEAIIVKLTIGTTTRYPRKKVSDWGRWVKEYPDNPEKRYYVGAGVTMLEERGIPIEIYECMETELKAFLGDAFDEFNPEKTIAQIEVVANKAIAELFSKHMSSVVVGVDTIRGESNLIRGFVE